ANKFPVLVTSRPLLRSGRLFCVPCCPNSLTATVPWCNNPILIGDRHGSVLQLATVPRSGVVRHGDRNRFQTTTRKAAQGQGPTAFDRRQMARQCVRENISHA